MFISNKQAAQCKCLPMYIVNTKREKELDAIAMLRAEQSSIQAFCYTYFSTEGFVFSYVGTIIHTNSLRAFSSDPGCVRGVAFHTR